MVEQEVKIDALKIAIMYMVDASNQLKVATGSNVALPNFQLDTFWHNLVLATKAISTEVTKLCLIYSKDPLPTETEIDDLLHTLGEAFVDLLASFYTLHKNRGVYLYQAVHKAVVEVSETVTNVVSSLQHTGAQAQKERLSSTGLVWQACEAIEGLPRNNLAVILNLVKLEESLVADAVQEVEEEVKSDNTDDVDSEKWTNHERSVLPPCIGLVKTARSCLKKIIHTIKTKGMSDNSEQIAELDNLARTVKNFSSSVDDFIESIYPPMERLHVQNTALVIVGLTKEVLNMAKASHYTNEEDYTSWIDFLLKAVDHNNNKLQSFLNTGTSE